MDPPRFVLFGAAHLWTVTLTLLVAVGLPLIVRRLASEKLERAVQWTLAGVLVLTEGVKPWVFAAHGLELEHHLPLHLCSVAAFLTAILLVRRSYRLYEVVYFWGLGGTLLAIVTPDLYYGFPHPFYLGYFTSHGLIIVGAIYATVIFRFRPTMRSVVRVFCYTVAYAFLFIAPLNVLLDTNYLYLRQKPYGATLIDYLGPWPWYIGSLAAVAWVSFLVCYSPFLILDWIRRRRAASKNER